MSRHVHTARRVHPASAAMQLVPDPIVPDEEHVIARILAHADARTTDTHDGTHEESVDIYTDTNRFAVEQELVFRVTPTVIAASAEVNGAGAYLARANRGTALLFTRDERGKLNGMLNACRHRGSRVAPDGNGCAKAFVCPYHGWTYDRSGSLLHVPHEQYFGPAVRGRGLRRTSVIEHLGLAWLAPDVAGVEAHAAPVANELRMLRLDERRAFGTTERIVEANWKIIVESFLEGYHIRVLHRDSFYPYGFDNLTLNDTFGCHRRLIFPFRRILSQIELPIGGRRLRRCATVVYHLFPNVVIAAQPYHVQVFLIEPLGIGRSRLWQISLTEPGSDSDDDEKARRDAEFLAQGLDEDMRMCASIQHNVGALDGDSVLFGANEGSLAHFHSELRRRLGVCPPA